MSGELETYYLVEDLYDRVMSLRSYGLCEYREIDLELIELGLVELVVEDGLEYVVVTDLADANHLDVIEEWCGLSEIIRSERLVRLKQFVGLVTC